MTAVKHVLHVAIDHSNPIQSGFDAAKRWADAFGPEGWYITSHRIGSRTNTNHRVVDTFAYEVCIDRE